MVYVYRHDKTQITYGKEATWGTAAVGSIWMGHVQSHEPDWNYNIKGVRYIGSNNRTKDDYYELATDIKGKIEVYPQDWRMLTYAFGKVSSAGGSAPYTHTITESGALPSFTLEDIFISNTASNAGNVKYLAKGCMIDTLEISGNPGEPITMSIDYIGQTGSKIASGTKTTVTAATTKVMRSEMTELSNLTGAGINGAISGLDTYTFRIKNNLSPRGYLNNSKDIGGIETGGVDYEFKFKIDATEATLSEFENGMHQAGSTFNADMYIFRTSGTDQAHIWMSGARVIDIDVPRQVEPGPVEIEITAEPQTAGAIIKDAIVASGDMDYP